MNDISYCDIAIVFKDLTEFLCIKKEIDQTINSGLSVRLFIAQSYSKDMQRQTYRYIKDIGYDVIMGVNSFECSVLLEPYPIPDSSAISYRYRIKYRYSSISAKPSPVYSPEWNIPYDAFMVYSTRDASAFSAYGNTHLLPYLRLDGISPKSPKDKLTVLYLPTFGEINTITWFNDTVVSKIKESYRLIIKAHHAIQYHDDYKDLYNRLKLIADVFYDSDVGLGSLLADAQCVVSDSSSAVFDAVYVGVPVAVAVDDKTINKRRIGEINTPIYEYVTKGLIPQASSGERINQTIRMALKNKKLQKDIKQELFPKSNLETFSEVLKKYVNSDEPSVGIGVRRLLKREWSNKESKIKELNSTIEGYESRLSAIIDSYEGSKSWRATKPLRSIRKKLRG